MKQSLQSFEVDAQWLEQVQSEESDFNLETLNFKINDMTQAINKISMGISESDYKTANEFSIDYKYLNYQESTASDLVTITPVACYNAVPVISKQKIRFKSYD